MMMMRRKLEGMIVAAFLAVIMVLTPSVANSWESMLQRCCRDGETWAVNHTSCTGPPNLQHGIPSNQRQTCSTAMYICCIRTHRHIYCEKGKEAAKTGKFCDIVNQHGGEAFKDCCDGCSIGLQAGSLRLPCTSMSSSFGYPWDEAYIDCCESMGVQGTSPFTEKNNSRCASANVCSHICEDVGNQIRCSCQPGYTLGTDQKSCHDDDECRKGTHTCNPATQTCQNTLGSFTCVDRPGQVSSGSGNCDTGFIFNQEKHECVDINECESPVCGPNALCFNTIGSYTCRELLCEHGFVLHSGISRCTDRDECAEGSDNCDRSREICQNSFGSFQCIPMPSNKNCPAGFKWSDVTENCQDVDECLEDIGGCADHGETCRNTVGGYECDPQCDFTSRYDLILQRCVDTDECLEEMHQCSPQETCVDNVHGYTCLPRAQTEQCPPGFKPAADGKPQSCVDINECTEWPDSCPSENEICVNEFGSYSCVPKVIGSESKTCPPGFIYNPTQNSCSDIDECLDKIDTCDHTTQQCVNSNGSYECVAKTSPSEPNQECVLGFTFDPVSGSCIDVDECVGGRHRCIEGKEQCVNLIGTYRCDQITVIKNCPTGRKFNVSTSSCEDIDECAQGTHTCDRINENCINSIGSYRCIARASCPHGYKWARQGNKCEDVNECAEGIDDCDRRAQNCINTVGSFQCQTRNLPPVQKCGTGFVYDANRAECIDLNECDVLQACSPDQVCENTVGSYRCVCQQGFTLDPVRRVCKDINECQLGIHSCAVSQRCDNTVGSFSCVRITSCGTGYTLNAALSQCEDDDECQLRTHNCGPGFVCRNIEGSFRCDRVKCPPGQRLLLDGTCQVVVCPRGKEPDDAGICQDINECSRSNVCRPNQRCVNSIGSYRCQNLLICGPGFEIDESGSKCLDVDECARNIHECGSQQTCRNRPGGYVCECPIGYSLGAQRNCEDIDECTRFRGQVCSTNSECQNTQGSYICNCKEGFKKAEDGKNCIDVDECEDSPNVCQQTCINAWGSYHCSCQQGYNISPDGRSCQDVDECSLWEGRGSLCIGFCVNEPGSYSCSCPDGYSLGPDKRTCQDIDECQEQNVCKGDNEVCLNTRGSFKCNLVQCPPNYVRDKDHRNRCKRASMECREDDTECLKIPMSLSYNYITFPSNMRIPPSGQLDLFTMRGPRFTFTTVQFSLDLKNARSPDGVPVATRDYFYLRRTAYNEAMVSLIRTIQGPQDVELELTLKMYHNGLFGGTAVAKLFIFVTQHEF